MEIKNRVFIVSGGGSGLGKATATYLHKLGGIVVIADLNAESAAATANQLEERASFIQTNVTDEESVRQAVAQAVAQYGALHGAINCAGIGIAERVLSKRGPHALATFTKVIQVNLIGTFNLLRLAAEAMARNEPAATGERGVIINTASVAAYDGQIGQIAYAASKGGVVALTLPAARDLAQIGVRVVTIAPGLFDTPLLASLPEAARASLAQQVPFPPRLGDPSEYAALVAHIVENPMLNGEVIRLDGAIRMAPR